MPSKVEVQVVRFRPRYEGSTLVDLVLRDNGGNPVSDDGQIKRLTSYKLTMPRKTTRHSLVFTITPGYVLLGVQFINNNSSAYGQEIGQHVFTDYKTDIANETLTLTIERNAVKSAEKYEVFLLIQRKTDGQLGIVDPEWENE